MHSVILLPAYLAITVAPLVLAWMQDLPRRPVLDDLSSGLAMAAFAILLVEFVLSGRFRTISGRIGMDVTMRFHQLVARTALAFVLLHPFLYRTPFGPPLPWDVTGQSALDLDIRALASGMLAWVVLPGFVAISIWRDQLPYRYETWRLLHLVGAVVIAVAMSHHTLTIGRYSADPMLSGFWLALLSVAIGSLVYARVVAPILKARRPYRVVSVRKIALRTWEVAISPIRGQAHDFTAGQFAWLSLGRSAFSLAENPFSISSAPAGRPRLEFVIKEAGDLTDRIGSVRPGTVAHLDGPHGNLTLDGRTGVGIALIAGGVGIAPLLAIARQLEAEGDRRPLVLLYGNRVEEQIVYRDELDRMGRLPSVRVEHVVSQPAPDWGGSTGWIDRAAIERVFGFEGARDWLYLVCGPAPMLDAVEDALVGLGVPTGQIVSERFRYD